MLTIEQLKMIKNINVSHINLDRIKLKIQEFLCAEFGCVARNGDSTRYVSLRCEEWFSEGIIANSLTHLIINSTFYGGCLIKDVFWDDQFRLPLIGITVEFSCDSTYKKD
jgi:hypothetical protein